MSTKTAKPQQTAPFLKSLASSRREIRFQALASLRTYLSTRKTFSLLEYRKLWKGLYYCLYMQDKPKNQQSLAVELASLMSLVTDAGFVDFNKAFYLTMREQWEGLDRLRLDKFLYLIRRVVRAAFDFLSARQWDAELTEAYLCMMEDEPLHATDARLPNGLRFHVAEVWLDELEAVDPERNLPSECEISRPLTRLVKDNKDKIVRKRIQETLDDERWKERGLDLASKKDDSEEEADDDLSEVSDEEWGGLDD